MPLGRHFFADSRCALAYAAHMTERLYVFCYDNANRKARARVARCLEDHAVRVQRSVFEARMNDAHAQRMGQRLARELGPGDSLKIYALGTDSQARAHAYGAAIGLSAGDYLLV